MAPHSERLKRLVKCTVATLLLPLQFHLWGWREGASSLELLLGKFRTWTSWSLPYNLKNYCPGLPTSTRTWRILLPKQPKTPGNYAELPKDEEELHNIIGKRLAIQESHKVSVTMPRIAASPKVISSPKAWTEPKRWTRPPLPEVTPRCFALFPNFTGAPPVSVPIARLHCKKKYTIKTCICISNFQISFQRFQLLHKHKIRTTKTNIRIDMLYIHVKKGSRRISLSGRYFGVWVLAPEKRASWLKAK